MPLEGTAVATALDPRRPTKNYGSIVDATSTAGKAIKIGSPVVGGMMFILGLTMYEQHAWSGSVEIGVLLIVGSILLAAFGFIGGVIVCGQAHTMQILIENRSR